MKKHLFLFLFLFLPVLWLRAQPGPIEPISKTISVSGNLCSSANLYVNSTWPSADCSGGGSLTTYNVYTNFYLERSNNGTSGWAQVASTGMQTNNTAYTFNVANTGYYRCRMKMTLVAYGSPSYCWNGSYTWEYLYTNVLNLSSISYQPAVAYTINGSTSAFPTAINVYNCQNILLGNSSTGTVQEYRLNVIRANSDGTVPFVSNPYEYNPLGTWTSGSIPASLDLKALTDIEIPGYYKVILEARNLNAYCSISKKEALVKVSGPPTPASADFKMLVPLDVNPTGKASRSGTRPGVQCGPLSVGIGDVVNSTPDPTTLTSYQVVVREVNCSGPEGGTIVISGPVTTAPGGTVPGSFLFNSALIPNGYFINACMSGTPSLAGKCYKVTIEVNNVCNVPSSISSYFHFPTTAAWYNCYKNNNEQASETIGAYLPDEGLTVYPNPATEHTTFSLLLANGGRVTMVLYSLTGQKVWEYSGEQAKGLSEIKSDLSQLPAALYHYRVETPLQVYTGKIIKR